MDAFYASVEQRDNPALRGKPVAVGGDPDQRGVVAAASYEARTFGVRSAIPMSRAVRLCPSLVIVRPDFHKYRAISQQVFAIYREVTPLVEPLSLDEAYLDVTENAWGEPLGVTVARRLKDADQGRHRPHRVGRRRAEQVPRQDRVGMEEARRADGGRARARRDVPAGTCRSMRCGASGPSRPRELREHGIEKLTDVRARSRRGTRSRRRQPGAVADRAGSRPRRPAGGAESAVEVRGVGRNLRHRPRLAWPRSAARSTRWRATSPSGCRRSRSRRGP